MLAPEIFSFDWENKATVRTKKRLVLEAGHKGYFYPLSRQPLCLHPLIEELGTEAINFLLVQSFYKYLNDIAVIETQVVNQAILRVLNNSLPLFFSTDQKQQLYTIMVDEAYHAYVAYDAMNQIQKQTGIAPLPLPEKIEIELAIHAVKKTLDPIYHGIFDLIAVCLAENTLTKEIVTMLDHEETHPFFQQHIKTHLADETRHSGLFFALLAYIWKSLNDEYKTAIAAVLPTFLSLYLGMTVQMEFDKRVLLQLGLSDDEASEAISDTYSHFQVTRHHPMLANILIILEKALVLDGICLTQFKERNWI